MRNDEQTVKSISISYRVDSHKSHITCAPERVASIMRRLAEDGATDIKILHYYDESGMMIKKVKDQQ
jgi:hypothetical protein